MVSKWIPSMVAILTIIGSIHQATAGCICISVDNFVRIVDIYGGILGYFINDHNAGSYSKPPDTVHFYADTGSNSVDDYPTYYFDGTAVGRIFLNYDGQSLSSSSRYTAVGCPLFTSAANTCAAAYGFGSAGACTTCGTCCCIQRTNVNRDCIVTTTSSATSDTATNTTTISATTRTQTSTATVSATTSTQTSTATVSATTSTQTSTATVSATTSTQTSTASPSNNMSRPII